MTSVSVAALSARMLEDLEHAPPIFHPTRYWRVCSRRLIEDLSAHPIERFRSFPSALAHFVPTYIAFDLAADPAGLKATADALEACLPEGVRARQAMGDFVFGRAQALADYRTFLAGDIDRRPFLDRASESEVGAPVGQVVIDGRRLSRSMLNYLLGLCFAKRQLEDLATRTVLEIGGGFGSLGEILCTDGRNDTFYIDVDIPPTAVFSTYYLGRVLGPNAVLGYDDTADWATLSIEEMRRRARAAVLCSWQLPKLRGSIDLFVNFISFQEMEPPVVKMYLGHVDRLQARHVLLRNLREGKQLATSEAPLGVDVPTRAEDYDAFLPNYELVASNTLPFGYQTPDGYHSELRLYRRR